MPKVMKICKACGKEYEACRTPNPGIVRWRDVACSLECAEKYFHDVAVARGEIVEEPVSLDVHNTNVDAESNACDAPTNDAEVEAYSEDSAVIEDAPSIQADGWHTKPSRFKRK